MAKNKRGVFLSAEVVNKLITVLKKQVSSRNLNVKEKQLVNRMIGQLQAKLDATPRKGIILSNKLVGTILMTLANLLFDSRVVNSLMDLFFSNKK